MAGNFLPDTPAIERSLTRPLLLRSNMQRPTTPIFLSEVEAAPVAATYPVVYSVERGVLSARVKRKLRTERLSLRHDLHQ